jgi:hypothetical protein
MIQYWVLFNLLISLYELYCYKNRSLLLSNTNLILDSWGEYSRVDPRYLTNMDFNYEYVWNFELFNVFNTLVMTLLLICPHTSNNNYIKLILMSQLIATVLYFLTLLRDINDDKLKQYIIKNSTLTKRILYYFISSLWILVPLYFLSI